MSTSFVYHTQGIIGFQHNSFQGTSINVFLTEIPFVSV